MLTEVDALRDEVEVARERRGYDRARESRLRGRIHEAAGSGPRTGWERGRLVDLSHVARTMPSELNASQTLRETRT